MEPTDEQVRERAEAIGARPAFPAPYWAQQQGMPSVDIQCDGGLTVRQHIIIDSAAACHADPDYAGLPMESLWPPREADAVLACLARDELSREAAAREGGS